MCTTSITNSTKFKTRKNNSTSRLTRRIKFKTCLNKGIHNKLKQEWSYQPEGFMGGTRGIFCRLNPGLHGVAVREK